MSSQPDRDASPQRGEAGPPQSPAAEPKRPLFPPSRIILLIILAVACVAIVLEYRAKWPYESSVVKIEQAMDEGKKEGTNVFRRELADLLSGSFTRDYDEKNRRDTIRWTGAVKSYSVRVGYGKGGFIKEFKTEPPKWVWKN